MKAITVLSHMFLANVLVLSTLVGLAGVEGEEGGYLWEALCILSPLALGYQIRSVFSFFQIQRLKNS